MSALEVHKIVHRTNPSHQSMNANCGKWFRRKWDLNLHLQKHKGTEHKCDHNGCTFTTATEKQLKEHKKGIRMITLMSAKSVTKVSNTGPV